MMNKLRWISLPIACILVWYTTLVLGMLIINFSIYFCPKDQMISGMCTASWWDSVEASIFCFSTGLSAALIVTTAFFIAPWARFLLLGLHWVLAVWLRSIWLSSYLPGICLPQQSALVYWLHFYSHDLALHNRDYKAEGDIFVIPFKGVGNIK